MIIRILIIRSIYYTINFYLFNKKSYKHKTTSLSSRCLRDTFLDFTVANVTYFVIFFFLLFNNLIRRKQICFLL